MMGLDTNAINDYLQPLFGEYEDSFQEAWVEILERNTRTVDEIAPIVKKVRNKAITRYLQKKFKEKSLQEPLGNDGDGTFTLESILASPTSEHTDPDDNDTGLYAKMVDFLIGEYLRQKSENVELRRKEIHLKAERLRLREESLKFEKDRFESWRQLMQEKGEEKERRITLKIQLQRERQEFQRELLMLKKTPTPGVGR